MGGIKIGIFEGVWVQNYRYTILGSEKKLTGCSQSNQRFSHEVDLLSRLCSFAVVSVNVDIRNKLIQYTTCCVNHSVAYGWRHSHGITLYFNIAVSLRKTNKHYD